MLAMSCAETDACIDTCASELLPLRLDADATRLRLGFDHAIDALAFDDPGWIAVDADLVGPRLHGEALGEPDHAPLGGGIGRAKRDSPGGPPRKTD